MGLVRAALSERLMQAEMKTGEEHHAVTQGQSVPGRKAKAAASGGRTYIVFEEQVGKWPVSHSAVGRGMVMGGEIREQGTNRHW